MSLTNLHGEIDQNYIGKKRVPSSWLILFPCSLLTMHWMNFAVVLCQALAQCKWANRVDEQRKSKQWKSVAFMQLFLIHFPYYLDDWESLLCRNPKTKVSHGRGVPYLPTHVVLLYERCSTLLPPTLKNHFSFNFNPLRPVSNVTLLPCLAGSTVAQLQHDTSMTWFHTMNLVQSNTTAVDKNKTQK